MSLVDDITILKSVPMLRDFSDDQLRLLAFSAETSEYRDGMKLFDEGDRADGAMVIASGKVSLQKREGDEFAEVDVVNEGTLLGETAILVETRRPCRAIAMDRVRVIRIRRALFKRMMQEYPDLAQGLFDRSARKYHETAGALAPIGQRLAALDDELENARAK